MPDTLTPADDPAVRAAEQIYEWLGSSIPANYQRRRFAAIIRDAHRPLLAAVRNLLDALGVDLNATKPLTQSLVEAVEVVAKERAHQTSSHKSPLDAINILRKAGLECIHPPANIMGATHAGDDCPVCATNELTECLAHAAFDRIADLQRQLDAEKTAHAATLARTDARERRAQAEEARLEHELDEADQTIKNLQRQRNEWAIERMRLERQLAERDARCCVSSGVVTLVPNEQPSIFCDYYGSEGRCGQIEEEPCHTEEPIGGADATLDRHNFKPGTYTDKKPVCSRHAAPTPAQPSEPERCICKPDSRNIDNCPVHGDSEPWPIAPPSTQATAPVECPVQPHRGRYSLSGESLCCLPHANEVIRRLGQLNRHWYKKYQEADERNGLRRAIAELSRKLRQAELNAKPAEAQKSSPIDPQVRERVARAVWMNKNREWTELPNAQDFDEADRILAIFASANEQKAAGGSE